mgnify:CR=1 FL=1
MDITVLLNICFRPARFDVFWHCHFEDALYELQLCEGVQYTYKLSLKSLSP